MAAASTVMMAAMAAMAAGSMAQTGYSMANQPDAPKIEDIPLPKDASKAEKEAHKAATDARKRQKNMATLADGRGSTILTGGGKLGELGEYNEKPKGLLGL